MKKKVIKIGGSLAVIIPAKWAAEHNITRGTEVEIGQYLGYISVESPEYSREVEKKKELATNVQV